MGAGSDQCGDLCGDAVGVALGWCECDARHLDDREPHRVFAALVHRGLQGKQTMLCSSTGFQAWNAGIPSAGVRKAPVALIKKNAKARRVDTPWIETAL